MYSSFLAEEIFVFDYIFQETFILSNWHNGLNIPEFPNPSVLLLELFFSLFKSMT